MRSLTDKAPMSGVNILGAVTFGIVIPCFLPLLGRMPGSILFDLAAVVVTFSAGLYFVFRD
jgi:hypothetical protein